MKKSPTDKSKQKLAIGKRQDRQFSTEDRRLWRQVAATVTPLYAEKGQFLKDEMNRLMEASAVPESPGASPLKSPAKKSPANAPPKPLDFKSAAPDPITKVISHPIEDRTVKNLGKGRQAIDARIDLHGMTRNQARFALLYFLQMAQRANHRIVLVITGKGNQGRGVLRENVPRWLSLPTFAQLVNGYRESEAPHGGGGALYVRIRQRWENGRHRS